MDIKAFEKDPCLLMEAAFTLWKYKNDCAIELVNYSKKSNISKFLSRTPVDAFPDLDMNRLKELIDSAVKNAFPKLNRTRTGYCHPEQYRVWTEVEYTERQFIPQIRIHMSDKNEGERSEKISSHDVARMIGRDAAESYVQVHALDTSVYGTGKYISMQFSLNELRNALEALQNLDRSLRDERLQKEDLDRAVMPLIEEKTTVDNLKDYEKGLARLKDIRLECMFHSSEPEWNESRLKAMEYDCLCRHLNDYVFSNSIVRDSRNVAERLTLEQCLAMTKTSFAKLVCDSNPYSNDFVRYCDTYVELAFLCTNKNFKEIADYFNSNHSGVLPVDYVEKRFQDICCKLFSEEKSVSELIQNKFDCSKSAHEQYIMDILQENLHREKGFIALLSKGVQPDEIIRMIDEHFTPEMGTVCKKTLDASVQRYHDVMSEHFSEFSKHFEITGEMNPLKPGEFRVHLPGFDSAQDFRVIRDVNNGQFVISKIKEDGIVPFRRVSLDDDAIYVHDSTQKSKIKNTQCVKL